MPGDKEPPKGQYLPSANAKIMSSWPRGHGKRAWLDMNYGDTDSIRRDKEEMLRILKLFKWRETIKVGNRIYMFVACDENARNLHDNFSRFYLSCSKKIIEKKTDRARPESCERGERSGRFALYTHCRKSR